MKNPWFRLYAEFATDPKVQSMPEPFQRRFVMLLCLKCSGDLPQLTEDEIAFALRISIEELTESKQLFLKKGFIDEQWGLRNWDKRQFVSDDVTKRVQRYRDKKRTDAGNETFQKRYCNGNETAPDTDTDTDTEADTEKEKTTTTTLEAGSPDPTNGSRGGGGSGDSFLQEDGKTQIIPPTDREYIELRVKHQEAHGGFTKDKATFRRFLVRQAKDGKLEKDDWEDMRQWESERAEQAKRRQEEDRKAAEKREEAARQAEEAAKDRRLREEQAREQQAKDRPVIKGMCAEFRKNPQSYKEIVE